VGVRKLALPSYPLRAVHLIAVWAYAVSQPVFSLLEANPDFLVVRGSTRVEIAVFAVVLAFGPPLLAVAVELALRLASTRAADVLHLAALGAFVALLALQVVKTLDVVAEATIVGSAVVSVGAVVAYTRFNAVRLFLAFSVVLPLAGLATLVFGVPLATTADVAGANVEVTASTPIVLIVMDEFPVTSLLTADGRIDATRYPNFTRLARGGTWYSRATTVAEHTTHAIPAILDGKAPTAGGLPTLSDHPENLFTLLGESYRLRVVEPITHLCPRRYCARQRRGSRVDRLRSLVSDVRVAYRHRVLPDSLTPGLPRIDDRWGGYGGDPLRAGARDLILGARSRAEVNRALAQVENSPESDFWTFLGSIRSAEPRRTLHFLHLLLPHRPWRLLPSGRGYGNVDGVDGAPLDADNRWDDDLWLVRQTYQRHLLQLGYADRLVGRTLDRLEASGLYDDSLVVVTADHGISFAPAGQMRIVSGENLAAIARVPLFVKFPGQRRGRVETRDARTIDVLPTIADVLGVELPWTTDGRSLRGAPVARDLVEVSQRDGTVVAAPSSDVEKAVQAELRRKAALFGEGDDSLYEIGSNRHLLGMALAELPVRRSGSARVDFEDAGLLAHVRQSSSFTPARVVGSVEGIEIEPEVELAVAVNGRIVALTRSRYLDGRQRFAALVPEDAFRDGRNRVSVLAIHGTRSKPLLVRLGETGGAQTGAIADATP
jgi:Sulfatase